MGVKMSRAFMDNSSKTTTITANHEQLPAEANRCWVSILNKGRVLLNLKNLPNSENRKLPKTECMTFKNQEFLKSENFGAKILAYVRPRPFCGMSPSGSLSKVSGTFCF